nr:hypothetical protein [Halomonas desiderata]
MTARWAHLPYELLEIVSNRIINEIRGVSRMPYDVSSSHPRPSSGSEARLGRTPDTAKLTEIKGLPKGRPFFFAIRYKVLFTQAKVAETTADRTGSTTQTGLSQGKDVIPGR